MSTIKSFAKSSLVLDLASMALLFNACRKSSSSMDESIPARFRQIVGTYVVTDTIRSYSSGSVTYTYNTLDVKVSAIDESMIQFNDLLNDKYSYDYTTRTIDSTNTIYKYYTYNASGYYSTGANYTVNVTFSGNEMYYNTYSSANGEYHKGKGIKR
jgi:hypothetical protein